MDLEKAFDSVPRKVLEWTLRKKGIPEVLVRSMISMCKRAKTKVRVDTVLSEEFAANMGMHQESVLSPFLLAVVVDVATKLVYDVVLTELQYADDFVLMSETIKGLSNNFLNWKENFEDKRF